MIRSKMRYRLVTLFPLTILVCSVMYAGRLSSLSDLFNFSAAFQGTHSLTQKRLSFPESPEKHQTSGCAITEPTDEDYRSVPQQAGVQTQDLSSRSLHCHVIRECPKMDAVRVTCVSYRCRTLGLRFANSRQVKPVKLAELSREIELALVQKRVPGIDHLKNYMSAVCLDAPLHQASMDVTVYSLPPAVCRRGSWTSSTGSSGLQSKMNLHVFYLRFLSRWEMEARLPGVFSLLQFAQNAGGIGLNFKKLQATRWKEMDSLSRFFSGPSGSTQPPQAAFLKDLQDLGYCVRLQDLSCNSFPEKEQLFATLISGSKGPCHWHPLSHRERLLDMLCTEGNMTDVSARHVLTSLLADVHGVRETSDQPRPVASATYLNTKPFKNQEILDMALRNVISGLLSFKNNIVIVLSDLGSPSLLRLDQPVRLQSQSSNPAFAVMSFANLSRATLLSADNLNKTIFSLQDALVFLKNMIRDEPIKRHHQSNKLEFISEMNRSIEASREVTCAKLQVQPPLICLCERESIGYENDTLMVGFAELIVGVVNARLRKGSKADEQARQLSRCSQIEGVSFSDVRMRHVSNRKVITMDLVVAFEGSKERISRHALLAIWDMDKIPKVEAHLSKSRNTVEEEDEMLWSERLDKAAQDEAIAQSLCQNEADLLSHTAAEKTVLQRLQRTKHFGVKPAVIHMHDNCLYLLLRDFGDSVSVHTSNICRDRQYDVMLHLSLINMVALAPLPIYTTVGHAQTEFLVVIVKTSYTVLTFAYKLHPDFNVMYDK